MTAKEIVKKLMKLKDVSNIEMARRQGISRSAMWDRLNSERKADLSVAVLNNMLKDLGYKLVIMPGDDDNPGGSYVVD